MSTMTRVRLARLLRGAACACAALSAAEAAEFKAFSTSGLPRSEGVVVRLSHPAHWKPVPLDDGMALAELRGPHERATGILQIGRGGKRDDMEALCRPDRARTMLQGLVEQDPGTRVTQVLARKLEGRAAFDLRYERSDGPEFLRVRSLIVCLKDSRLVVSCGAAAAAKAALAELEPVCSRVLDSLAITEE